MGYPRQRLSGSPCGGLLGGKVRDKVRVYTHLGLGDMRAVYETLDAAPLVERAHEVVARGYRAFKAVFIPYTHYHAPLPEVDKVARMMEALRAAVGPEVEIMVDFHGRPASAAAALAYIKAIEPGRPMFVEEPVPPGETGALKQVALHTSTPLATGERLVDRLEFHDLLAARAVDIIQPDICHCGGILEAKKIAALAEAASVGVAPHNPLGPIAGVAALHFAASTPNHVIQEEMVGAVPWYFDVVQVPIRMVDGFWQIPEAPGLGVEVNESECEKHPFAPEIIHSRNAVLDDGTLVDWEQSEATPEASCQARLAHARRKQRSSCECRLMNSCKPRHSAARLGPIVGQAASARARAWARHHAASRRKNVVSRHRGDMLIEGGSFSTRWAWSSNSRARAR